MFFLLSLGFLIDIVGKMVIDFDRLTKFGWGYIAGKIILLLIFILLTILLFTKTYGKKEEE